MTFNRRILFAATALAGLLLGSGEALAQSRSGEVARLEELVVTAQRREEKLQDVPVAVSVFSGKDLEAQQVVEVRNLYGLVPGVWMGAGIADPTDITMAIRGLSQQAPQSVTDPPVGVYVDGVYRARTPGSNVSLVDMERIEVLKGPQGTLLGRNTIGGAFSIITNKPTDEFEGSLTGEAGNYQRYVATAVANVPIAEGAALRFVFQHLEHEGYGYNAFLDERVGTIKQDYGRITFRGKLGDNLELVLFVDNVHTTGNQLLTRMGYYNTASPFNVQVPTAQGRPNDRVSNYAGGVGGFYTSYGQRNPNINIKAADVTSTLTWSLPGATVRSITSFRDLSESNPGDIDGTPFVYQENLRRYFSYEQLSQELQIFGSAIDGRLDWIGGVYYLTEEDIKGADSVALLGVSANTSLQYSLARNENYAAFAQLTYEVAPDVRLTGGLRWTKDSRNVIYSDQIRSNATGVVSCAIAVPVRNDPNFCRAEPPIAKWSYMPWTVGVDYKPVESVMLYAKATKGHRSGGFSQTAPGQPVGLLPFNPENLLSYEGGAKLELFDRRVRLNAAVYYSEYKNVQVSVNGRDPASGVNILVTRNVGDGHIQGGELDASAVLGALRLRGSLGYTDPTYTAGPALAAPNIAPFPFVNAPKYTASAGASFAVESGLGTITLNADYNWRSKVYFFPPNSGSIAGLSSYSQDSYGLLDAKVDLDLAGSGARLSIWAKNLMGKKYLSRGSDFVATNAYVNVEPGEPFTFGATARYAF